jgi:hypothetical protein
MSKPKVPHPDLEETKRQLEFIFNNDGTGPREFWWLVRKFVGWSYQDAKCALDAKPSHQRKHRKGKVLAPSKLVSLENWKQSACPGLVLTSKFLSEVLYMPAKAKAFGCASCHKLGSAPTGFWDLIESQDALSVAL